MQTLLTPEFLCITCGPNSRMKALCPPQSANTFDRGVLFPTGARGEKTRDAQCLAPSTPTGEAFSARTVVLRNTRVSRTCSCSPYPPAFVCIYVCVPLSDSVRLARRVLLNELTLMTLTHTPFPNTITTTSIRLRSRANALFLWGWRFRAHHRPEAIAAVDDIRRLREAMQHVSEMEIELGRLGDKARRTCFICIAYIVPRNISWCTPHLGKCAIHMSASEHFCG